SLRYDGFSARRGRRRTAGRRAEERDGDDGTGDDGPETVAQAASLPLPRGSWREALAGRSSDFRRESSQPSQVSRPSGRAAKNRAEDDTYAGHSGGTGGV